MDPITYIERTTGKEEVEKVYKASALGFVYGNGFWSRSLGTFFQRLISKPLFFSSLYGALQKRGSSKKKIRPFIKAFNVDPTEFAEPIDSFSSFNDFFIRKLKPEARPLAGGEETAIMPADARYLFYPNIEQADGFVVKGQKFELSTLLDDKNLASQYSQGTMVIARLCPSDYHRFHFPCDCIPGETKLINGWLYSVNPAAIKKNIHIFSQNKRTLCELETKKFGKVLFMEIGATSVGSIHQTYTPCIPYPKGAEKGYFSFGASSLILLFQPGAIALDQDLTSHPHREIRCLMGQSLGKKTGYARS